MQILKNRFYYIFVFALIVIFLCHYFVLNHFNIPIIQSKLIESYLINGLLVISFFLLIKLYLKKIKNNLGFIFIALSLLKFILFFIFINPSFKLDNTISTMEFTSFFIPYFFCLFVEVYYLSKLLNNLKF